ncbi:MAG: polysaccharide deacetylase family protein [Acidobacteriota bacterium]
MNPISHPLHWKYQKNAHLVRTLLLHQAPEFVYRRRPEVVEGEIPVFTFHGVDPEQFEAQCLHLAENGYRTLTSAEFESVLSGRTRLQRSSVLLTFDDGLKEVWTVAFPLLRRYGLKATCFLIPGLIPAGEPPPRPNLAHAWREDRPVSEILAGRPGEPPVATWPEIRIMHESGVVDFQSHTMYHALVHTSGRVFDFVNPNYDPYFYGNLLIPLYRQGGKDVLARTPVPGMPIYAARPRMQAPVRFLDDERVRDRCAALVAREGPRTFFADPGWRRRLRRIVQQESAASTAPGRFESPEERDREVLDELIRSRRIIEEKLPGAEAVHLCYPWFEAHGFAMALSVEAGYRLNYFGYRPGRPTNRPGDDPLCVVRVDELYLQRLPGTGRLSLREILRQEYLSGRPSRPRQAGPASQEPADSARSR